MDPFFRWAPSGIAGATLYALGYRVNEWQFWAAVAALVIALQLAEERGAREHRPPPRRRYVSRIAAPD